MPLGFSYIDSIVYDAEGYTGNIYYYRWVEKSTAKIWDDVLEALITSPSWENSSIVAEEQPANTGTFLIKAPAKLPAGIYDVIIYKQEGSSPQNTDGVEKQYDTNVGGIFKF